MTESVFELISISGRKEKLKLRFTIWNFYKKANIDFHLKQQTPTYKKNYNNVSLTHFSPVSQFYTPRGGYRNVTQD